MARTESPKPAPSGGEDIAEEIITTLGIALWGLTKFAVIVAWWAILFPMISLPLAAAGWFWHQHGWPSAVAIVAAQTLFMLTWRFARPVSFRLLVSGRLHARWRTWWVYRRRWARVCALHNLTATLDDSVLIPRLDKVHIGDNTDTLTVSMLVGQDESNWQQQSAALAHAFGVGNVRISIAQPGVLVITVHRSDALTDPLECPPPPETVDLADIQIGATETGQPWNVAVLGNHILVAGATGAGKGSVVWSILNGLAPAVGCGVTQVWVIDPKGGMEFGHGQPLFTRFSYDAGQGTLELLRDAAAILTERANRLRGVTRLHTPSVTEPLIVVVIDEIASLTAYISDRAARNEVEHLLGLLLSQGRAVGVSVIAAVQDPSKDVLPIRQLFPTRIALRLSEASQIAMVLGNGARERGAVCDQIPDTLPGVGYVGTDGKSDLVRARAFHVTDHDIAALTREYQPDIDRGERHE